MKIITAGSILVDKINVIRSYPKQGELVQIESLVRAVGGLVPNTGRDIHILAPDIPVWAFGKVGDDEDGAFAIQTLQQAGLDVSGVVKSADDKTSFTNVMSVIGGERTFFTYPGASAKWGYEDFPFDSVSEGDIVLLGYFLLLDKIDRGEGLLILQELKKRGARTAIDLVTENSDRYNLVRPCLPYVDNLIINEVEATRLVGREGSEVALCKALLDMGVRERVIIHRPEKGVSQVRNQEAVEVPSLKLPSGFIKDKTGAGDAFCAGSLVGIAKNLDDAEILRLASMAAAAELSEIGTGKGIRSVEELQKWFLK